MSKLQRSIRELSHGPVPWVPQTDYHPCGAIGYIALLAIFMVSCVIVSSAGAAGVNIRTPITRLKVDEIGRIGIEQDISRPSQFYNFADQNEYLKDGSLILGSSASSLSWSAYDGVGCSPLQSSVPMVYDTTSFTSYRIATGEGLNGDGTLGFDVTWYASKHPDSAYFFVGKFKVYKGPTDPTGSVNNLTIAFAADWDLPLASATSNSGGGDASRQMVYQMGPGSPNAYGAIAATRDDFDPIVGGFVWENSLHIDPFGSFDQNDLWTNLEALTQGQYSSSGSTTDLSSVLVIGRDLVIDGADADTFKFSLIVACQHNLADLNGLNALADKSIDYSCHLTPLVGISILSTDLAVNTPVVFTPNPILPVASYDWDFGDGTPHSSEELPIHLYSALGLYIVKLTANIPDACIQTIYKIITINGVAVDFAASPRYGSLDVNPSGLVVQFTDFSAHAPTNWSWDFGDPGSGASNFSNLASPVHTYLNPGVYTVSLTASNAGSTDTKTYLKFIRVDPNAQPNLEVNCFAPSIVTRGFHKIVDIVVTNVGSADAPASTLSYDISTLPAGVTLASLDPQPTQGGPPYSGVLTWDVPAISWDPTPNVFDEYHVTADLDIDVSVPGHTTMFTTANISQVASEVEFENNEFIETEEVVAPHDPNFKSVQPTGCGPQHYVKGTQRLNYFISFENKASASGPAYYVIVVDTLDPNLDPATFQAGPSSKDNVLDINFDPISREIIWLFDGYNLPPNVSPPEGEGYVSFSVMPMPGLPENTVISNRAHIRFDFEAWLSTPEGGPLQVTIQNSDLDNDGIIDACELLCGDADASGIITISDAVYLINYIFAGGPAPNPLLAGDSDCNGIVTISDAVYLINYIFSGGPAPCAACP